MSEHNQQGQGTTAPATAPAGKARGRKLLRAIPLSFFREGLGTFTDAKGVTHERKLGAVVMSRFEKGEEPIRLGAIFGRALSARRSMTVDQNGNERESIVIMGTFEAERFADGHKQQSGAVYLPSVFVQEVAAHVEKGEIVNFAVEIGAEPDPRPNAAMPYTWTVHDLLGGVKKDDPLRELRGMVAKAGHDLIAPPAALALAHDADGVVLDGQAEEVEGGEGQDEADEAPEPENAGTRATREDAVTVAAGKRKR